MDLLDFFTGDRAWFWLYPFIDRLPYSGHYKSALSMDADWARVMLDQQENGEDTPPLGEEPELSPLGYTEEIQRLDLIADRVMSVRTAVVASFADKHKEPSFEPIKRPKTAIEKERERRGRKVLLNIEAELFGTGLSVG